jgi:hypothetical protein
VRITIPLTTCIDAALIGSTSLYALWLWRTKKVGEPNHTWLKVVFGTVLCLGAAGLRSRAQQDMAAYERNVWRCFVLGGLPVIIEEFAQAEARRRELQRYLREGLG